MRRMHARRRVGTIHGVRRVVAASIGVLGVGLAGLAVWAVASYGVLFQAAHDRYQAADVRPLRHLIATALPVGATVGQARAVLRSPPVTTFVMRQGFDALRPETPPHPVASFDDGLDESEVYPQGAVLFAGARNGGNGALFSERYLTVRLFFDATGRFIRCTVDESAALL